MAGTKEVVLRESSVSMHSSGESCSLGLDCQGAPRSAVTAVCWAWECNWIPAPAKEDSGTSYAATARGPSVPLTSALRRW